MGDINHVDLMDSDGGVKVRKQMSLNNLSDIDLSTSPVSGQVLTHDGTSWVPGTAATGVTTAIKTSDQTVTNSTTLVNDTELLAALEAENYYYALFSIMFTSTAVADLKINVTVPSGTTGQYDQAFGTVVTSNNFGTSVVVGGVGAITERTIAFNAFIKTSSTAGNVQFQFAQNTQEASDTKILEASNLLVWDMGAV